MDESKRIRKVTDVLPKRSNGSRKCIAWQGEPLSETGAVAISGSLKGLLETGLAVDYGGCNLIRHDRRFFTVDT